MNTRLKGTALAVTGACMWGIMGIFVRRLSAAGLSNYDISFLRCILAGVAFFLLKACMSPKTLKTNLKGLAVCVLYGVVAYGVSFVSYGMAVERIPVAVATVLMFMSPVWVTILGIVIFHEKLKSRTLVIIMVCIIGASMVANLVGTSAGTLDGVGIFAGILNGFGVSLQIMIPRYFADQYDRDTMLVYGFLGAAVVLAFFSDFGAIGNYIVHEKMQAWMYILGVGILCTMVANVAFVKSTIYISTTTSSILSSLEVVVGAIVGFLIFGEHMTGIQILGAVIVVIASLGPGLVNDRKEKGKKLSLN